MLNYSSTYMSDTQVENTHTDTQIPVEINQELTPDNNSVTWGVPPVDQCSTQYCPNGHTWSPQLALPHCNECRHPLLALRQVNCPVCNEPVVKTRLRIDHVGGTHPITKTCIKEYHIGPEYIIVEIDHTHNSWITDSQASIDPKTQSQQVVGQRLAFALEEASSPGC